jgi:hypothetical protein
MVEVFVDNQLTRQHLQVCTLHSMSRAGCVLFTQVDVLQEFPDILHATRQLRKANSKLSDVVQVYSAIKKASAFYSSNWRMLITSDPVANYYRRTGSCRC